MQTALAYNGTQVKQGGTKDDIKKGFKLWLDLVNPSPTEIKQNPRAIRYSHKTDYIIAKTFLEDKGNYEFSHTHGTR